MNSKKTKASVLVFSLIILFLGVVAALGIASSSIIAQKNSITTASSVQSFQLADSGAEIFLNKLKDANSHDNLDKLASDLGLSCRAGIIEGDIGTGRDYSITSYNTDGPAITDCNATQLGVIDRIRSVGSYKNTSRAVEMSVASFCSSFLSDANTLRLFHFEDDSLSPKVVDSSSNADDGDIIGNVATSNTGICKSKQFNGTAGNYVSAGNLGLLPDEGTIEFWFNTNAVSGYPNPVSTNYNGGNNAIRFEYNTVMKCMGVNVGDSTSSDGHCIINDPLADYWYYIAYSWDISGGETEFSYYAGVAESSINVPFENQGHIFWPAEIFELSIGGGFDGSAERTWNGEIDEFRISKKVFTKSEIEQHFLDSRDLIR